MRTLDGNDAQARRATTCSSPTRSARIALAGIMGGEETEVSERTTSVLLEAANFEPIGILRSSERLSLRTEGSNRWEKGVDPYLAGPAAVLATQLLVELAGARWTGAADVQGELPKPAGHPAARDACDRGARARRDAGAAGRRSSNGSASSVTATASACRRGARAT